MRDVRLRLLVIGHVALHLGLVLLALLLEFIELHGRQAATGFELGHLLAQRIALVLELSVRVHLQRVLLVQALNLLLECQLLVGELGRLCVDLLSRLGVQRRELLELLGVRACDRLFACIELVRIDRRIMLLLLLLRTRTR